MSDEEEEVRERLSWLGLQTRREDDADYDAADEQEEEVALLESGWPEAEDLDAEERLDDRGDV